MSCMLSRITHSLLCHKFSSPQKLILRRISFLEKIRGKPILLDKSNHRIIYEFKYIVFPAGLLKWKYLMPIASAPLVSGCFYLDQPKLAAFLTVTCFIQTFIVLFASRFLKNMIGKIYVNKKGKIDNVILSSIDSNGNRIDESFSPDQLSLSGLRVAKYLGFVLLETDTNKNYKINVKNIIIHDLKALKSVLSEIVYYMNTMKSIERK